MYMVKGKFSLKSNFKNLHQMYYFTLFSESKDYFSSRRILSPLLSDNITILKYKKSCLLINDP